jgi:hypothetical protein
VAQSYINDLVNRSMILPVDIGYDGQVQSFQVHGLVLNIIQNMSAEHNFVTVVDGQQSSSLPKKIRRLSLPPFQWFRRCADGFKHGKTIMFAHLQSLGIRR